MTEHPDRSKGSIPATCILRRDDQVCGLSISVKVDGFADKLAFLQVIVFHFGVTNYNLGIVRNCGQVIVFNGKVLDWPKSRCDH
jgi:hypothetical protein